MRQREIRLRFHGRLQLGAARLPRDNVVGQRRRYNYDDLSIGVRAIRTTRVEHDVRDVPY